ncbi:MAG TPA: hypothetical protein GXZ90_01925 [Clostridiales bacterium]|nr:hypothetical protein [Clostridiales bacterium]
MTKYGRLQIIKHALQYYVQREGVTEEEMKTELSVLKQTEQQVIDMKLKYRIDLSEYEENLLNKRKQSKSNVGKLSIQGGQS